MSFYDDIKAEMKELVYNEDADESELIEYWPAGAEANKREIWVVLDRPNSTQNGNVQAPMISMNALNDSREADASDPATHWGVASTEIDTGTDLFKFSERYGDTPKTFTTKRIETHDKAELVLIF
jgi:hypothetical protein